MKNKVLMLIAALSISVQVSAAQITTVVITGNLPTWKMHMTENGVVGSPLNAAYNKEESRTSKKGRNSSATLGALIFASTGVGLMVQLSGASYNGNSNQGFDSQSGAESWGGWNDLTSKNSSGDSTLDADIKQYEANLAVKLNTELQNVEDPSGKAFIESKGFVQKVRLNKNGIMVSFTTSIGYSFEREERKDAVSYLGVDVNNDGREKVRLFINAN